MVYMLLGTGFEETEAIAPLDLLRRAGVEVMTVGLNGKIVRGGHGIGVEGAGLGGDLCALQIGDALRGGYIHGGCLLGAGGHGQHHNHGKYDCKHSSHNFFFLSFWLFA